MSQKNLEGLKCWNEINVTTRNTAKLHKINWTIENVSTAIGTKIIGPEFYLEVNCLFSINTELSNSNHYVTLVNKSDTTIKIQRDVTFLDCDGKVIHHHSMGAVFTLYGNSYETILNAVCQKSQITSLKDDKLIIQCLLKVEGRITTQVNFFKSEMESRGNLIDDWKKMYNNPIDSDLTLQIGDKIIHTHKIVLIARSAYFRRMFQTEMKEQAENTVVVTDVLYPTMQKLVEFLYSGCFPESQDNDVQEIFDLYIAADKYDVVDLRALCGERLLSSATAGNVCQILQLAQRHGDEELKIRAMDFIFFKFDVIENSNAWKTFISSEAALTSEVLNFCFKRFKYTF
ncbi:TD and POZ domain-containing protein 2 [Araneus ventricosus]|uniref:TD and POZ domain-containing protein 2 n=1 Tax=Araneus ventricosus TaxID=182803 RepID=A0A4Y2C3L2_ARAVE|nr:TD and POZ domain-containing protein 2 [Araneus ventricosus]